MNRPDQFWNSIDILATAYFEGELVAGSCNACAVGNLVQAHNENCSREANRRWYSELTSYRGTFNGDVEVAPSLPYTAEEIDRIERAFESSAGPCELFNDGGVDYFPALMDVVDILMDIHGVEDEDLRREATRAVEQGDYTTVEQVL